MSEQPSLTGDELLSFVVHLSLITLSLSQASEALVDGDVASARAANGQAAQQIDELLNNMTSVADRLAASER